MEVKVEVLITGTLRVTRTYYSAGAQLVAMRVATSTGGNALQCPRAKLPAAQFAHRCLNKLALYICRESGYNVPGLWD